MMESEVGRVEKEAPGPQGVQGEAQVRGGSGCQAVAWASHCPTLSPVRRGCPLAGPVARGTILRALGAAVNRCFLLRVIC